MLDTMQWILGALSGGLVGFSLGLVGGGGSILAVPLMVYLVGVSQPHVANGTSALAVAANAATGLFQHARAANVRWKAGLVFAAAGIAGAFAGSTAGKNFDGQGLLFLFALLMIVVGALMLRSRKDLGDEGADLTRGNAPKVGAYGLGAGLVSGFFGIGGGFLIVPGLIAATRMPMIAAVGTSLVAVTAFGLTTAANYAFSGLVNWELALVFVIGGVLGSYLGTITARRLSGGGQLKTVFAILIFVVAAYMFWQSAAALWL
ncbi:sulfite exporter TauE/SafE family protein [Pseudoblastomonas halimionae]|uniref:Probable membrane transporter protein n=1 Tax=Alteriqipengyuania halimionae TaxID=1926630 RepID=A0A6I4U3X9_9SPHN|nr:sulfite exporter TauE/SafE family protein [Alteriqipengyuania halimionae]MXP09151.1 TSUP family transporter [Alteriqipengyuania halimionae]